jgi:BTB/POZ domain
MALTTSSFSYKLTYKWTLSNFKALKREDMESPVFSSSLQFPGNQLKWQLMLRPSSVVVVGGGNSDPPLFGLFLTIVEPTHTLVTVDFSISILRLSYSEGAAIFNGTTNCRGWYQFADWDQITDDSNGYLVDSDLVITCAITGSESTSPTIDGSSGFITDFRGLMRGTRYPFDVSLTVGRKVIKAHKLLLATRSPQFRVIFAAAGQDQTEFELTAFAFKAIRALVTFMYTGQVTKSSVSQDLLEAAHYFEVQSLVNICKAELARDVADTLLSMGAASL